MNFFIFFITWGRGKVIFDVEGRKKVNWTKGRQMLMGLWSEKKQDPNFCY